MIENVSYGGYYPKDTSNALSLKNLIRQTIQRNPYKKPSILKIPFSALEEIPDFLRGKGWVRIGAIHETSDELSFDTFLKRFSHGTSLASYVAPLLELAGIVEIDRSRPAKIRLKPSY